MATATQTPPEQIIKRTCALLHSFGIEWIAASFDGSGDSGDFGAIWVMTKKPLANPASDYERQVANLVDQRNLETRKQFCDFKAECCRNAPTPEQVDVINEQLNAFEQALWHILPGGWENNEGSFGDLTVDVVERKIHMVVNERISDINQYTREF